MPSSRWGTASRSSSMPTPPLPAISTEEEVRPAAPRSWMAPPPPAALSPTGAVVLDEGAVRALGAGKSLLPAGIVSIEGDFQRGDAVIVKAADGRELGRGLVAYSAADAKRIISYKTSEIESLLGYRGRDEMIHRDDMVLD